MRSTRPPGRTDRVLAPRAFLRDRTPVEGDGRDWKRLARYVRARRNALGFSTARQLADVAGLHRKTIEKIEGGRAVGANTLAVLENNLGWEPGSAGTILNGGLPDVIAPPATAGSSTQSAVRQQIINATAEELVNLRELIAEFQGAEVANSWLADAIRLQQEARREREESNGAKEVG